MRGGVFRSSGQQFDKNKVTNYNRSKDIRGMHSMGRYLYSWFKQSDDYEV